MKAQIKEKFFPFTLELKVETQQEAEILFNLANHNDKIPHIISGDMSGVTSGDVKCVLEAISEVVMSKLDAEKMLLQEIGKDIKKHE